MSSPDCRPRWATPRSPDRPTQGPYVAEAARRLLRRDLLPWQRELSDVAGEFDPSTGRFAYSDVVVVVPRRAGKTLLALATQLQRGAIRRRVRCKYTAQTREDAARQYRLEWLPMLEAAERRRLVHVRRSNGSETVTLAKYGSTLELFAPNAAAGHGHNADVVFVDEVWWFTVEEGLDLQAGLRPAGWTRPLRQRWWITAGGVRPGLVDHDVTETFLDQLMDQGRAAVDAGVRSGVCYVEYSADPAEPGYDPYDEALWWRTHPALGHTIPIDALRDDAHAPGMTRELWERSALNVWPRASGRPGLLTVAGWPSSTTPVRLGRPLWFAVDVTPDRSSAAIAAAGPGGPGIALELVDHNPGADWIAARLVELHRRHRSAGVVVDRGGPAAGVIPQLERAHIPVEGLDGAGYAAACAGLVDAVRAGRVVANAHPDLLAAIEAAKTRPLGDAWAWGRRRSEGSIAPLVAVTLACRPVDLGADKPQPALVTSAAPR